MFKINVLSNILHYLEIIKFQYFYLVENSYFFLYGIWAKDTNCNMFGQTPTAFRLIFLNCRLLLEI